MKKLVINIQNTNFEVIVHNQDVMRAINVLKERYLTHSYLYSKSPFKGGKPKISMVPDKMYYAESKRNRSYRFAIHVLKDFLLLLGSMGVTKEEIEIKLNKTFDVAPLDVNINKSYTPKDYQDRYIDALIGSLSKKVSLIDLIMGYGKAQPLTSKIKIPYGWSTIGDIKVGQSMVNQDGTIGVVTGKFPQGLKRIYSLIFEDGRMAEATAEHLWKVYPTEDNPYGYVVTTLKLIEMLHADNDAKVFMDLPIPYPFEAPKVFKIDPYTMGTMIINNHVENLSNLSEYFSGNLDQRVNILRGILSNHKWSYNYQEVTLAFNRKEIADTVIDLSRSIGDIAGLRSVDALSYEGTKEKYIVDIYSNKPFLYFIPQEELKACNKWSNNVPSEWIKDRPILETPIRIELKEIKPYRLASTACISVNHQDQLYVTDNYVVTHNTFISVFSITKLNMRTMILILPKYIDKWLNDLKTYTDVDVEKDVYVVKGSESLIELMDMKEIPYKFIVCSMRTMSNYVKEYEEDDVFSYPVEPQDLIRHLKVGVLLNDETHQEFHALFKCCLYFDPPKLIGMTATIETKDKVQDRMYKTMFPESCRISNLVEYVRYVDVKATRYACNTLRGIQYRRPKGYSHVLFEQTIMRNHLALREYMEMIGYYIKTDFMDRRKDGQKAIVFAATVDFCSILMNHFKKIYPKLDVRRYVEDDVLDNVLQADLCFTTVISEIMLLNIVMY